VLERVQRRLGQSFSFEAIDLKRQFQLRPLPSMRNAATQSLVGEHRLQLQGMRFTNRAAQLISIEVEAEARGRKAIV
jgi:hypothetical protein